MAPAEPPREPRVAHRPAGQPLLLLSACLLTLVNVGALPLFKHLHGTGQESAELLMKQFARLFDDTKAAIPTWAEQLLPSDTDTLKQHAVHWLRSHAV